MPADHAIGVVVVSYASASTLPSCLERLLLAQGVARVLVIDNASPDHSADLVASLARHEPRLGLVRNSDNRGFAAACNQGASALSEPWLAFVNPDAFVETDTLVRLVDHARQHPGAGLLGVHLIDDHGQPDTAARRMAPNLSELLRGALQGGDRLALGRDPALALQPVEALSGALMLMPHALFLSLGGFDEGYRMHAEDLDLCRRVCEAGYDVLVANDVPVVHVRGVSSRSRPLWVEWQKHRGLWRYLRKFDPRLRSGPVRLFAALAIGLRYAVIAPRVWWRAQRPDQR